MNKAGLSATIGGKRYSLETPGQLDVARLALLLHNVRCVTVQRASQDTVYVFTLAGLEMASEWCSV